MSAHGGTSKPDASTTADGPDTRASLALFMAQAVAMEFEAAQRYAEFADAMDTHNNREVAALFRTMAKVEGKHAAQIMATMGWSEPPPVPPASGAGGLAGEAAETAPSEDVHYLMQPYHALQIALASEQRAQRFFAAIAAKATVAAVRDAALELEAEEREHVEIILAWMKKVPVPDSNWADDPDPPRFLD